ncbi:MAG: ZinT/AdcA family metal-binding protein [Treponema sp.]|nr:ZinT/AdcA family metal-binding protein [Treponema sp.]
MFAVLCLFACSAFAFAAKKSIVCVTYPEYDWVMNILGEKSKSFDVTLIQNNGTDLHSYQPSVKDVAKISKCDILIYVGGESDEWVEKAVSNAKNKKMVVINMMEVLGDKVREEEVVEGMQAEDEHDHGHDGDHDEHHAKEVSTFDDHEVKNRNLSDWEGEWQSAYPLVLDGSLDEAWEEKAKSGKKTAEGYKEYYKKGYKTDLAYITIKGDKITYKFDDGKTVSSKYKSNGVYIQNWSTGTKAAMYRFEAVDKKSGAPVYIEFNDHTIEPNKAEHFHFRMSNESYDAIVDPENLFPTYYPAKLSPKEVCEEIAGHDKHGHGHDDEEEAEYDEHVWLSLRNAVTLTRAISEKIQKLDSANAAVYKANTDAYTKSLSALNAEAEKIVASSSKKTILFADRYPFRYFSDDYGLKYYAAFVGCSAESEANFETVVFLSKKVDELSLGAVLTIEKSDKKIAKTVVSNTKSKNQQILEMDSLQSVTQSEIKGGRTYLSAMKKNLEVLKKALN